MAKVETIGKILVRDALPNELKDFQGVLNKKGVRELFTRLAKERPDKYVDVLHSLMEISRTSATEYGKSASVGLDDLRIPPSVKAFRDSLKKDVDKIAQSNIPMQQKNDAIVNYLRKNIAKVQSTLQKEAYLNGNSFALGVEQGFRGNPTQLTQLLFGDMLVADHKGTPIPIPGLHGYAEGTTPLEYWSGSYGARKGYSDVQFATADTGYFGKQMALMAQRTMVTGKDCGAKDVGVLRDGGDADILGSVLAKDSNGVLAGTVIDKEAMKKLDGHKILVRSVSTCQQEDGICQKCAGHNQDDKFPEIGDRIGITVARSLSEPLTQLGLSSKHVGGQVGVNDKVVSGFQEVNQFVQVPKRFMGGAVLADKDGKVESISKAPQGGWYINIGGTKHYAGTARKLRVAKGDTVDAGDVLTDGTPNPAEIAKYKGLGEGREYFVKQFGKILSENGVPAHSRSLEILSKGFFDKVKIMHPDGVAGYGVGEVVPYSSLQKHYKPRVGTEVRSTNRAIGRYLEKPILHYTIGTPVTKKVAQAIKDSGINEIPVHTELPHFTPEVIRLATISSSDPDWKTRMAGFGLKKTFLESATKGSESPHKGTSYVPGLMDASLLG